ncbi:AAA family ATPase [Corallococcus exiguus]|nr:AAA family ATPase [Corallococcus exiguus]
MIESITLANFKSFGEQQTLPLEPITVLVGPNNSGKSNFMSVARFLTNSFVTSVSTAMRTEGDALFHRPIKADDSCRIRWDSDNNIYELALRQDASIPFWSEYFQEQKGGRTRLGREGINFSFNNNLFRPNNFSTDHLIVTQPNILNAHQLVAAKQHWAPFTRSRTIKLSVSALRVDAEVIPNPEIGLDGRALASVLGLWRGAMPEKAEALNGFLSRCLPEIKAVLVKPAPVPGHQRLWFRQQDGLEFDAEHVSDGVLAFTALAMHALSAEPGQFLCIEEPEQSIHPKRLREFVDLLKDIVRERGCQFIIATHSTVLLNAFRDEPEAILLFRRSEKGTRVKRLSDVPELVEALQQAPPGDLLETGAFSTAF